MSLSEHENNLVSIGAYSSKSKQCQITDDLAMQLCEAQYLHGVKLYTCFSVFFPRDSRITCCDIRYLQHKH